MTTTVPPICYECKHFITDHDLRKPMRCSAFPDGIPQAIIMSQADHRKPYDGDHGIQFESANAHGDAYASMIFDHRQVTTTGREDTVVGKPVIAVDAQPHNANWLKSPAKTDPSGNKRKRVGDHVFKGPRPWK